ncbi:hypothetical protein EON67_00265 [archaeon]|nr:MAG: hypothetical protein EON67_00265 [archaeon]
MQGSAEVTAEGLLDSVRIVTVSTLESLHRALVCAAACMCRPAGGRASDRTRCSAYMHTCVHVCTRACNVQAGAASAAQAGVLGVIIIDSLAAVFRGETSDSPMLTTVSVVTTATHVDRSMA